MSLLLLLLVLRGLAVLVVLCCGWACSGGAGVLAVVRCRGFGCGWCWCGLRWGLFGLQRFLAVRSCMGEMRLVGVLLFGCGWWCRGVCGLGGVLSGSGCRWLGLLGWARVRARGKRGWSFSPAGCSRFVILVHVVRVLPVGSSPPRGRCPLRWVRAGVGLLGGVQGVEQVGEAAVPVFE